MPCPHHRRVSGANAPGATDMSVTGPAGPRDSLVTTRLCRKPALLPFLAGPCACEWVNEAGSVKPRVCTVGQPTGFREGQPKGQVDLATPAGYYYRRCTPARLNQQQRCQDAMAAVNGCRAPAKNSR